VIIGLSRAKSFFQPRLLLFPVVSWNFHHWNRYERLTIFLRWHHVIESWRFNRVLLLMNSRFIFLSSAVDDLLAARPTLDELVNKEIWTICLTFLREDFSNFDSWWFFLRFNVAFSMELIIVPSWVYFRFGCVRWRKSCCLPLRDYTL